ncbi:S-adenosyl-L-methionine-dependent methyltransferase [Periconia macrospinosa]|uniref:S-adenosyl-L-methionine-dependent methyltransferase n=1 Tax=Periconia macrospinosa TaxID=97972 RepID=A0A2V1DMV0_9PLEO|nr:S-adenosyl-L-methionine-dependent methyltransferase [Periconia macrospinosa]
MNATQHEAHMQFDHLGETYDIFGRSPFRQFMEYPTTFAAMGDISGLSILDYGCGSGLYTRMLKRKGANRCVGVDATPSMIEHAQGIEKSTALGAEYVVMDDKFPQGFEGAFDIVLAVYVLPFMTDVEQLEAWFRNSTKCLRPGGRLVAVSGSSDTKNDPGYFQQYGFRLYKDEAPEGTEPHPCKLDLCYDTLDNKGIQTYLWTKARLEDASKKAGFGDFEWCEPVIKEGKVDQSFWEPVLSRPNTYTFRCTLL